MSVVQSVKLYKQSHLFLASCVTKSISLETKWYVMVYTVFFELF